MGETFTAIFGIAGHERSEQEMQAGVFWGSRDCWIWKQWQTLWYGSHRLQRGRKLEQKDLVKESSSRAGPPLYGIEDECKKNHKPEFWRQRGGRQGARRRGSRPREAIDRLMTIPFGKRNCVCQNRWQLVKKIRRCYYCFQHHFRPINPPKHRQTHTRAALSELQLFPVIPPG